jgi:hypothetical protein
MEIADPTHWLAGNPCGSGNSVRPVDLFGRELHKLGNAEFYPQKYGPALVPAHKEKPSATDYFGGCSDIGFFSLDILTDVT